MIYFQRGDKKDTKIRKNHPVVLGVRGNRRAVHVRNKERKDVSGNRRAVHSGNRRAVHRVETEGLSTGIRKGKKRRRGKRVESRNRRAVYR